MFAHEIVDKIAFGLPKKTFGEAFICAVFAFLCIVRSGDEVRWRIGIEGRYFGEGISKDISDYTKLLRDFGNN